MRVGSLGVYVVLEGWMWCGVGALAPAARVLLWLKRWSVLGACAAGAPVAVSEAEVTRMARALYRAGGTVPQAIVTRMLNNTGRLGAQPRYSSEGADDLEADAGGEDAAAALFSHHPTRLRSLEGNVGDVGTPGPAHSPGPASYKGFVFATGSDNNWWSRRSGNQVLAGQCLLPSPVYTLLGDGGGTESSPVTPAQVLALRRAQPMSLVLGVQSHPWSGVCAWLVFLVGLLLTVVPGAGEWVQGALAAVGAPATPAAAAFAKLAVIAGLFAPLWLDVLGALTWCVHKEDVVFLAPAPMLLWLAWFAWCVYSGVEGSPVGGPWMEKAWFASKGAIAFLAFIRAASARTVPPGQPLRCRRCCGARWSGRWRTLGRGLLFLCKPLTALAQAVGSALYRLSTLVSWRMRRRDYLTLSGLSITFKVCVGCVG